MTLLTKAIRRELPQTFDRRNWIVELYPWGIRFRAKRTRKHFDLSWESAWHRAMEIEVASVRAEKKEARKLRGRKS